MNFTDDVEELLRTPLANTAVAEQLGTSESTIRRWRRVRGIAPATAIVAIPADAPSELEMLRDEVSKLRARSRREAKQEVGDERALLSIEAAAERLSSDRVYLTQPSPALDLSNDEPHHRMLGLWSDWHYGEVVDPAQMSGLNSFNTATCESRVDQLVDSTLAFKRVRPAVTGLNLAILGDMASGSIHGLEETNEVPAAEQYLRVGQLMASAVLRLAPHFDDIVIDATFGNHPRATEAPASKNGYNSGDWLAYKMAEALSPAPNVTWNIPRAGMIVREIAGKTFLFWHGDGVRSSMPGVPWGGVMRRVNVLKATYARQGVYLDYVCLGHFHQDCVVPGIFMNGALIGPNEYGLKNFGGGEPPKQLLITLDERRQRPTDVSYISFED